MEEKDKYGHYVNEEGVEISVNTDKKGTEHINIYDKCPAEHEDHGSIHINYDSNTGKGNIVDNTDGEKETTDINCFLTTACMRHMMDNFDDNCEELKVLRWFRDRYVSKKDINHYYEIAPTIVNSINSHKDSNKIYDYIYNNVIRICVDDIKNGNYNSAYSRYKNSVLVLEEEFAKPKLIERFVKVLKKG